jgi:hypothetical protein
MAADVRVVKTKESHEHANVLRVVGVLPLSLYYGFENV